MQLNTLTHSILVAAAALIPQIVAVPGSRCFNSGDSINYQTMNYHAARACNGYDAGNNGAFQGTYAAGERKHACVNVGLSKLVMEVGNLGSESFDLADTDCTSTFLDLVDDCLIASGPLAYGGRVDKAGWTFMIDANNGDC